MNSDSDTPSANVPGAPGAQTTQRRNLGRGLAALFGEEQEDYAELDRVRSQRRLPVGQLTPSPVQPRRRFVQEEMDALVNSVRAKGVLQPLLVRRIDGETEKFEIIAGERRWRAAQIAQVHDVPVIIRDLDDGEALEIALIENVQRENLTPLEEAEGYRRLMDEFAHTQEDLSRVVGKSRSHVANMLRLLNLPESVKSMVDDGRLTAGHARALLGSSETEALAREVVAKGLNVRQTEKLVARGGAKPRGAAARPVRAMKDADTLALEHDLSMLLGLKVSIALKGEGGDITISFESLEQLDDVLRRLKRV